MAVQAAVVPLAHRWSLRLVVLAVRGGLVAVLGAVAQGRVARVTSLGILVEMVRLRVVLAADNLVAVVAEAPVMQIREAMHRGPREEPVVLQVAGMEQTVVQPMLRGQQARRRVVAAVVPVGVFQQPVDR